MQPRSGGAGPARDSPGRKSRPDGRSADAPAGGQERRSAHSARRNSQRSADLTHGAVRARDDSRAGRAPRAASCRGWQGGSRAEHGCRCQRPALQAAGRSSDPECCVCSDLAGPARRRGGLRCWSDQTAAELTTRHAVGESHGRTLEESHRPSAWGRVTPCRGPERHRSRQRAAAPPAPRSPLSQRLRPGPWPHPADAETPRRAARPPRTALILSTELCGDGLRSESCRG